MENEKSDLPIHIRLMKPEDEALIMSSWITTFWKTSKHDWKLPFPEYAKFQRVKINRLWQTSFVLVACDTEDHDHIYGWICGQKQPFELERTKTHPAIIHYAHTKDTFRKLGIFTKLLNEFAPWDRLYYTHRTQYGLPIAKKNGATFCPYLSEGDIYD